jgi:cytochrome c peroxidase
MARLRVLAAIAFAVAGFAAADRPRATQREAPAAAPAASSAEIALGRRLFMDRRLSANGTMSCGMCHVPEQGFAANELATAVGMEGRSLRRNAPTLLDVGRQRLLFHDGRSDSLEAQVWGPLLHPDEMANPDRAAVVSRVRSLPGYEAAFAAAYPTEGVTVRSVAAALAAYERSLDAGASRVDRHLFAADAGALTPEERRGLALFRGKAGCASCHLIGEREAPFTDHAFHNTGVGFARVRAQGARLRVPLAPGVETELDPSSLPGVFSPEPDDLGRFEVTGAEPDRFAYKTPSLRNVALTAPYMHDGSLPSLGAVVEFYDAGGVDNPGKDPRLVPLGLHAEEKHALVAFLRALTGANVERLAAEARAAASTARFP